MKIIITINCIYIEPLKVTTATLKRFPEGGGTSRQALGARVEGFVGEKEDVAQGIKHNWIKRVIPTGQPTERSQSMSVKLKTIHKTNSTQHIIYCCS